MHPVNSNKQIKLFVVNALPDPSPTAGLRASGAARTLDLLGDAWILRLLRSMFRGERRFSGFLADLGISRAVLTDRLDRLSTAGLVDKHGAAGSHAEYRLTESGLDFWTVLLAMWQWEARWGTGVAARALAHDRPRPTLVHLSCGHSTDPVAGCACCGQAVTAFDTRGESVAGAAQAPAAGVESSPRRFRQSHSDCRENLPTLLRVYGDRWNSSLMAAALQGARTFTEFSASTGIGPGPLTRRLQELQGLGMLRAHAYAGSRSEYRLTRAAIATFPITLELIRWGDRWLWNDAAPLQIRHLPCGQPLRLRWRCSHCDATLERTALSFT